MRTARFILHLSVLIWVSMPVSGPAFELLVVDSQQSEPYGTVRESMLAHLSRLGYTIGANLNLKYWSLGNAEGKALRVWQQEKNRDYDIIFLNGTVATTMFKKFAYGNDRYRFVFGAVTDPVGIGVINNFRGYPPANFTGICHPVKVEQRLAFIQKCMPGTKEIGFIYADMPQSRSYLQWIQQALAQKKFSRLTFHSRKVPFIKTEKGHIRMARLARAHVKELNSKVDLFLSPNDQLGIQKSFAKMVWETASKPLIGLSKEDVTWGAAMSIYPDLEYSGERIAAMMDLLFRGKPIGEIRPEWPAYSYAFDPNKLRHFGITIPENLLSHAGKRIHPE